MTRRYKPTTIRASRQATVLADQRRERENPRPAPKPEAEAWEAKPEPEPVPLPKYGKPPKVRPPRPESQVLTSMFDQAMRTTSDPEVQRRLRAAQREMGQKMAREVPPGADPAAYGF